MKIDTVLIPVKMYRDDDFTCRYYDLVNSVKRIYNTAMTNYYNYPEDIIVYLISKNYASLSETNSIYKTPTTGEFLNRLIALD